MSKVLQAVSALLRVASRGRALRALAELDDRALSDIGLLRSDVAAALSQPWRDPFRRLRAACCHWQGAAAPQGCC
jgi:uncharacterized protein YjiS (DUF1127 family)